MTDINVTIYGMLTTNTGIAMCDSGGDNGRMWQKNKKLTIKDFMNRAQASMELFHDEVIVNVDTFHYLTNNLELDNICQEFNSLECEDWNSTEFYGVSNDGEDWLTARFELEGDNWNTCNWDCELSQTLQGRTLKTIDGEEYILLQIHNGADVRGGYTDAKLFKLDSYCEYFLAIYACFESVDWSGEWINEEGSSVTLEQWEELRKEHKVTKDNSVIIQGSLAC